MRVPHTMMLGGARRGRGTVRAILLASAITVPAVSRGQPAEPVAAQSGTADAIRVLFDQATFWRTQYQPEKADEALARVLALDPQNADALALQAQSAADVGHADAAQKALRRLRAVRPDDPRIATVEQLLNSGPPNTAGIEDARRLSRENKPGEAVEAFRKAFHGGTPPPAVATEYYQMLAASEGGWEPARAGLAGEIRTNPEDLRAQLAYAELLTYHDETRDEGLDRLGKLVDYPSIGRQADLSYRKALFWLPSSPDSVAHYDIYMQRHPGDAEIANRETLARNDLNSVRLDGYAALQAGKVNDAQAAFAKALAANGGDSDALLGMALVRFKQKREAEGRTLIRRVIEIDPTKKDEFEKFLVAPAQEAGGNGAGDPQAVARIRADYARVTSLTKAGRYAAAEALLHRIAPTPNAGNYLQLADIQARAGHAAQSARSYRQALALAPRNKAALAGVGRAEAQAGHFTQAEALFARAGQRFSQASAAPSRAETLRKQAGNTSDPQQRTALLRQAVAADPRNPWTRLELARMLLSQGRGDEAASIMAAVTTNPAANTQQLLAGVYFANETDNLRLAGTLANRLPVASRDGVIRDIAARAAVRDEIDDAVALGSPDATRERMFMLAAQPDGDGKRAEGFALYLARHGDKSGAREVIRLAIAAQKPNPQQRIEYAGALLAAGYPEDAGRVTKRLDGVSLNASQTTTLGTVNDSIAASSADVLNGRGRPNAARDVLEPRLAEHPDSPDLNMALIRVYEAKQQPRRALAIGETLLQRNPDSLDVRQSALSAAVAAGDLDRARALADETRTMFPGEPQAWLMSADVARARGRNVQALQDLRTARTLRQEQLKASQTSAAAAPAAVPSRRYASTAAERASWQHYARAGDTLNDASGLLPIETDETNEPVTREYSQAQPSALASSLSPGTSQPSIPQRDLPPPASTPASPMAPRPSGPFEAQLPEQRLPSAPLSSPPPAFTTRAAPGALPPEPEAQPGVTAGYQPPDSTPFSSFRSAQAPLRDEPAGVPGLLSAPRPAAGSALPADPLLSQIDRNLLQVSSDLSPHFDASASVRGRSGAPGLERLFEFATPIEASFSPGGYGRVRAQVTPTYLFSGRISGGNAGGSPSQFGGNLLRFGTNPLVPSAQAPLNIKNQSVRGIGLDVGYSYRWASADVGTVPLGFQQHNIVGGVELAPRVFDQIVLRLLGERRAVTDSLLSYAGQEDYRTGAHWGGVTRNRGHAQLEANIQGVSVYAGGGGGILVGKSVAENSEFDAGAGLNTAIYSTATQQVRAGIDFTYFGFQRNLGGFTLGQGGYFSPQQYFAALPTLNYRQQVGEDLVFNLGGSIGFQTFREKGTNVFPASPALQGALTKLAVLEPGLTLKSGNARRSGLAGGLHGDIDYRVSDNLHVGASAGADRSGPFTEGTGLVYARYVFNDPTLLQ